MVPSRRSSRRLGSDGLDLVDGLSPRDRLVQIAMFRARPLDERRRASDHEPQANQPQDQPHDNEGCAQPALPAARDHAASKRRERDEPPEYPYNDAYHSRVLSHMTSVTNPRTDETLNQEVFSDPLGRSGSVLHRRTFGIFAETNGTVPISRGAGKSSSGATGYLL